MYTAACLFCFKTGMEKCEPILKYLSTEEEDPISSVCLVSAVTFGPLVLRLHGHIAPQLKQIGDSFVYVTI